MMNEPLSTIMTTNVITVAPNDSLSKVKEILFDKRFHHIPVVDNSVLVGIVTTYDLVKLNKTFDEYNNMKVSDIMTTNIVTLEPQEKIGAAAQIFLRHLFHGLPIIDDNKVLKGIVTTHDIMKYQFDKEYPDDELEKVYRSHLNGA
ncbi:MAG: CBS domain-containing protein [Saprospiraceae bacterium]